MNSRPDKLRAALLLGFIPLAGLNILLLIKALPGDDTGRDFRQLYAAGYMLHSGQASQLYTMQVQRSVQQKLFSNGAGDYIIFVRPAYEAMLFEPFSLLPYRTAYFCFLALNVFLLGVTVSMLSPVLGRHTVYIAATVLSFMPVSIALFAGQDSVLLTVILAASCRALHHERPLTAGMLTGLALFKFQLTIPVFLLFLVWRHWKFCYGFVLTALGLGILSISIAGVHQLGFYLRLLQEVSGKRDPGVPLMANLHGLLVGTLGMIPQTAVIAVHVGLACLLAIFLPRLREAGNALLLAIPAAVLCSYYLFSHDLMLLLLPIVAVLITPQPNRLVWWSAVLMLAPTALTGHSYLLALPLTFFLLELALTEPQSTRCSPSAKSKTFAVL